MDLPRTMGAPAENPSDTVMTVAHFRPRHKRGLFFVYSLLSPLLNETSGLDRMGGFRCSARNVAPAGLYPVARALDKGCVTLVIHWPTDRVHWFSDLQFS